MIAPGPVVDGQWHHLDPKSSVAVGALTAAGLVPAAVIMLLSDTDTSTVLTVLGIGLAVTVVVTASAAVSWYFTYYRVTGERFEMRAGNLSRSHRSIPRDRIRSVDVTARPVHRLLGLSVVKIGTGQQSGDSSEIKLDAIATRHAEALRAELLRHDTPPGETAPEGGTPAERTQQDLGVRTPERVLARLNPAWLGYSALTVSLAAAVWGALGSGLGTMWDLLVAFDAVSGAKDAVLSLPLWMPIAGGLLSALLAGALGALLLSAEMWWAFRLTREPNDTLRVRRGLLTARSVSLEERRLRGVELSEPLLLRWAGGARLHAVATGLESGGSNGRPDSKVLLPPAPRAEASRVAGEVLDTPWPPPGVTRLTGHPRAALRRRLLWSLVGPCALVAGLAVASATSPLPWWSWIPALVTVAVAPLFAVDAYRGLAHGLDPRHLVTRCGAGVRRTVLLRRDGVIGWKVRRSPFQRRSGLATVSAITAAGSGAYAIRDVGVDEGLLVAEEAVPGLLEPFLERPQHEQR